MADPAKKLPEKTETMRKMKTKMHTLSFFLLLLPFIAFSLLNFILNRRTKDSTIK